MFNILAKARLSYHSPNLPETAEEPCSSCKFLFFSFMGGD